jgi:hypothetical protein
VNLGKADLLVEDSKGNDASWYAVHYGHGTNKIIVRLLEIKTPSINQRTPNMPSDQQEIPSITVGTPSDDAQSSPRKRLNVQTPHSNLRANAPSFFTPNSGQHQGQATKSMQQFYTPNSSQRQSTSSLHQSSVPSRTFPRISNNTQTPVIPVSTEQIIKQKRAILGQHLKTPTSGRSNVEQLSPHGSPPLPSDLRTLLVRLDLGFYHELFVKEGIDLYMFLTLSDSDFLAVGIAPFGHRRKLMLSQIRFRETVEIRSTPETILSDYLLVQREQLMNEIDNLKSYITAMHMVKALNHQVQDQ